jgi:hypothetical protein
LEYDSAGLFGTGSPILGVPIVGYNGMAPLPEGEPGPVCAANQFDPNAAGYYLMTPLAGGAVISALAIKTQ